jgi:hypothetical protein
MSDADRDEITVMGGPYPTMQCQPYEFHVGNGITFWRVRAGVWIRQWKKEEDGWYFYALTLPPLTPRQWQSVVEQMQSAPVLPESVGA